MIVWWSASGQYQDEARSREIAQLTGQRFVDRLRKRFFDRPSEHPLANCVEVIGSWYVQRHQGKVVGGAHVENGKRRMVAGGPVVGSPVSARPIYEAMNRNGIRPSDTVSPWGRDAQRRHANA